MFRLLFIDKYNPTNILKREEEGEEERFNYNKNPRSRYHNWFE